MVTVLNYVIHLFDICSIVRKQYLDLWQVGKIIKVALTAALDTTATWYLTPRSMLCPN